jgi:hypothetical protein
MLNDEIEKKSIKKDQITNNSSQLTLICQTHNLDYVTKINFIESKSK